jgi:metallo-beta-lactamase class B
VNVVYADSLSAVSADDFRFSDPNTSPNNAQQIQASTALIRDLPCDLLLAPHPYLIRMEEKLADRAAAPKPNPFIDPDACANFADFFEAWLTRRLEEEAVTSGE